MILVAWFVTYCHQVSKDCNESCARGTDLHRQIGDLNDLGRLYNRYRIWECSRQGAKDMERHTRVGTRLNSLLHRLRFDSFYNVINTTTLQDLYGVYLAGDCDNCE